MKLRGLFTLLVGALLLGVGCTTDVDIDTSGVGSEGNKRTVRINATLPDLGGATRAAESDKGGVSNINWGEYQLRVIVKAVCNDDTNFNGETAYESVITRTDATSAKQDIEFAIDLTAGHTYDIYLWADFVSKDGGDLHYDTSALPHVTLVDGLGINDETYDAFFGYGKASVGNSVTNWNDDFSVERAVAKLRLIGTDADRESVAKAELQLNTFYNAINIATGEVAAATAAETSGIATLEDYDADLDTENAYVTTYVLWPAEGSTTLSATFYDNGDNALSTITPTNAIPLKRGHLTTLRGEMLEKAWDGNAQEPTVIEDGWLVISTPGELLWLAENAPEINGTQYTQIRLGDNINAKDAVNIAALKIYDNTVFDGNGKTLSDLGAAPASALFGSAQGLNAYNFTLEGYNVTATDSHVGVLVNELSQSATFSNITIKNSSATTSDGVAGGIVGYIAGGADSDLEVTFSNCDLVNVKADGTLAEGKFVGLMKGYDNGEILSFDAECSADAGCAAADYASPYTESNDAQWLDEGTTAVDFTNYDGWLGDEENYRAVVNFGGNRMQIKWDGETTVEPLLANKDRDGDHVVAGSNRFAVYSPFDLAGVRKKSASPTAIYLCSDIDMNGQGADGFYNVPSNFTQSTSSSTDDKKFDPFSYVTTLDGKKTDTENYSIYNLCIEQIEQERAAFILYASGTTVHKNINFRNCCTVCVHKPVETDAKAYGAILISNVDATYTMENVHAYDCKVFALQKVGTLGARISGTSTLKNCTVNNCYVENYECMIVERFESGSKSMAGFTVNNVYADFYPYGEVGGMFGFIQGNSTITNCWTKGSTIYAYGQNDQPATIDAGTLVKLGIAALGYYLVPGRHVSTLIGNIRATGTINITNSGADSSSKCPKRHDTHQWRVQTGGNWWNPQYTYYKYDYIGQAYFVKFLDSEGTVKIDGASLTIGDCKTSTLYDTY